MEEGSDISSDPDERPQDDSESLELEGYSVITIEGTRIGKVSRLWESFIVVVRGPWPFRTSRALPLRFAVVRNVDRTVVMLISEQELAGSPGLGRDRSLPIERVADYYSEPR